MSNIPNGLKYSNSHEWVKIEGQIATVGISDHAQHELTDIVFVELPATGRMVKAGEPCAVVESVKTASDIYSPVSGEVTDVNKAVVEDPALVNRDPYSEGWFYKLRMKDAAELDRLLSAENYRAQIGES